MNEGSAPLTRLRTQGAASTAAPMPTPLQPQATVGVVTVASYGLLGLPSAFVALPVYVHLPNLYAQQYGVPLAAWGGVFVFSRGIDAVVDPWLGRWGDRLYRHSGAAVWRAAVGLALAVALGFAALFFPPAADLSSTGFLVWVACALTLSHLAYSGLGILHQAWAARQGGGGLAQSRWVAWREGFALVGVLLASALPTLWGWAWTTALLVLMLALGLLAWQRTAQLGAGHGLVGAGLCQRDRLGRRRHRRFWGGVRVVGHGTGCRFDGARGTAQPVD